MIKKNMVTIPHNTRKPYFLLFTILLLAALLGGVLFVFIHQAPQNTGELTISAATLNVLQAKGCAGCHGIRGQGRLSVTAPPLMGQDAATLRSKIYAYKNGEKDSPVMQLMTQDLTDDEIDLIAEHYGAQK